MRLRPAADNPNYYKVISVQQSIISNVFTTTARINEAELKRKQDDKMKALLEALRQEQGS